MHLMSVDFPDPDGPSTHVTVPCSTPRLIPLRTWAEPKDLWTPSTLTLGRPDVRLSFTIPAHTAVTAAAGQGHAGTGGLVPSGRRRRTRGRTAARSGAGPHRARWWR